MKCKFFTLVLTTVLLAVSCQQRDAYFSFSGFAQGCVYSVTLNLKGVGLSVEEIKSDVDKILTKIDNSLSGYNKKSLISRFNAGQSIEPDNIFVDIYSRAYEFYIETDGMVDVASSPLFDLWGFGFKNSQMPDDETIEKVKKDCGMGRLKANMDGFPSAGKQLVSSDLLVEGQVGMPQLNYNAIAQGYSCDLVAEYLYSIGVKDMLVDIGEIFCDGKNPSGKQWRIGIDRPVDGNDTSGADVQTIFSVPAGPHGVVTSGNYRKFYVKDGKKYPHTINPRSGYPVSHNLLSATIVAPDATSADAYATYCMVIGLEESKKFLEASEDLSGCLIYDEDGEFKVWKSSDFVL